MAMIKCPECGHSVSENAPFCPNCGIKISQNIKKCPECNTFTLLSSKQCPHCGHLFSEAESVPYNSSPTGGAAPFDQPEGPTPKKSNKRAWIISIIVAVVMILGVGAYFIVSHITESNQEETAYLELENDTNVQDYEDFLAQYPNSRYAQEVQTRLNQLQAQNQQWLNISLSGSKNDFIQFMQRFPGSPYEMQCKAKIDSLDWLDAKRLNTPDALQRYIDEHADGKYVSDATDLLAAISEATVEPQEEETIRSTMSQFFTALGANDQAGVCASITPVMNNFLQTKGAKKADVINALEKMHPETITSMTFTVNSDFVITKTKSGDGYNYTAKFSVDQNIARTDEGKTFASYTVTAGLTPQFKINAISMSEVSNR